ncbi:MAG: hypothetical protein QF732_09680, partial [Nitrospinaceae bacterium]|nr:hypothetical protein [Nitrospinaceae bacterium]
MKLTSVMFLVIGLIVGGFSVALAQEAKEEEKDVFTLEEIVVTAQRREQDVQDVPISMTAISGNALASYRIEQSTQLASMVPNLNIIRTYGEHVAPVITVRGVNTQGWSFGDPAATAIYADDVVLNNQWSHGF